jgi:hypothetical protein
MVAAHQDLVDAFVTCSKASVRMVASQTADLAILLLNAVLATSSMAILELATLLAMEISIAVLVVVCLNFRVSTSAECLVDCDLPVVLTAIFADRAT